jgi:hypothetical protein
MSLAAWFEQATIYNLAGTKGATDHCTKLGRSRSRHHGRKNQIRRWYRAQESYMSITTILIIVFIVILLGGGGFYGRGRWY